MCVCVCARAQVIIDAQHQLTLVARLVHEAARVNDCVGHARVHEVLLRLSLPDKNVAIADLVECVVRRIFLRRHPHRPHQHNVVDPGLLCAINLLFRSQPVHLLRHLVIVKLWHALLPDELHHHRLKHLPLAQLRHS